MWPVTWQRPGRPELTSPRPTLGSRTRPDQNCPRRTVGWPRLRLRRPPARRHPRAPYRKPASLPPDHQPASRPPSRPPTALRPAPGPPGPGPPGPPRPGAPGAVPCRAAPAGDTSAAAAGTAAVRRRLARLGAPRGGGANPVLEPLIKTVRGTHPKADVRLIERAYEVAAQQHAGQVRKSGDP